MGQLEYLH